MGLRQIDNKSEMTSEKKKLLKKKKKEGTKEKGAKNRKK